MKRSLVIMALGLVVNAGSAATTEPADRIRPLADAYVTVYESPDPLSVFAYSPGLVRLESGRLIATMDQGGPGLAKLPGIRRNGRLWRGRICSAVDWCFAGLVTQGGSPRQARHYASMVIDGDDLQILSRSGDARAVSAHDGNLITFHTVHDFRALAY